MTAGVDGPSAPEEGLHVWAAGDVMIVPAAYAAYWACRGMEGEGDSDRPRHPSERLGPGVCASRNGFAPGSGGRGRDYVALAVPQQDPCSTFLGDPSEISLSEEHVCLGGLGLRTASSLTPPAAEM